MNLLLLAGLSGCAPEADPCQGQQYDIRFEDRDRDGQGNHDRPSITCPALQPQGYVWDDSDCDDTNDRVFRFAAEVCDGLDNNCDGFIDNGLPESTFYLDLDSDGFGDFNRLTACEPPPGAADRGGDCDDGDSGVNPEALERCDGKDNDCDGLIDDADESVDPNGAQRFYPDQDGDGFGDGEIEVWACVQPPDTVTNGDDCDDTQERVFPGSIEVCNDIDDDCDGRIDDSDPGVLTQTQRLWYLDLDQDGYGDPDDALLTCTTPWFRVLDGTDCNDFDPLVLGPFDTYWWPDDDGDGYGAGQTVGPTCSQPGLFWAPAGTPEDCDDSRAQVYPGRVETCDGLDNDCDGLVDDEDDVLDPVTTIAWSIDSDGDGYGGPLFLSCAIPGPYAAVQGDCDDTDAFVNPESTEYCNGIDDDCNGYIDDADPFVDPRDGQNTYTDADGDGYGDPFTSELHCDVPEGRVTLASDCDDTNPSLGPPALWWPDQDGDNQGAGVIFGPSCTAPQPTWVQVTDQRDCDDGEPTIFPGATDPCEDGVDQDCDGLDAVCARATCEQVLNDGLSRGDGVYSLAPAGGARFDVWCDMTTDGGGWTLVSSSTWPPDDAAEGYNATLATLEPEAEMAGIWSALRPVLGTHSDIRFACRDELFDTDMRVDLVFYDSHWYQELTAGTDEDVCFNEGDGLGYDQPAPARKNLLTGAEREAGNDWGFGYLEGEDSCASLDDFTVDFDNRGMDANQNDGTDWGEDDEIEKCGGNFNGEAWYIFVR